MNTRYGLLFIALFTGLLVFDGVGALAAGGLEIRTARWRPARAELRIEGRAATAGDEVLVRDADTHALLGCAAVRADGVWVLRLRNPKRIPARMSAECDSGAASRSVVEED